MGPPGVADQMTHSGQLFLIPASIPQLDIGVVLNQAISRSSQMLHDWCNKGRGMCYPVCVMVHIKEPLVLIDKSSPCGGSVFPFSLSEWVLNHMSDAI